MEEIERLTQAFNDMRELSKNQIVGEMLFKRKVAYGTHRYYPDNDNARRMVGIVRSGNGRRLTLKQTEIDELIAIGINISIV